jgi:hypothetical protein
MVLNTLISAAATHVTCAAINAAKATRRTMILAIASLLVSVLLFAGIRLPKAIQFNGVVAALD